MRALLIDMVIAEAFEVLRKYGLEGFCIAWNHNFSFPIDELAQLLVDKETLEEKQILSFFRGS